MAQYELLLPKMGESVAEATVIKWIKQPGDKVELDDTILEIATDKVDSEVPSPVAGTLVRHLYREDEVVQVGSIIAIIDTEDIDEPTEVPFVNQIKEEDILELNAPAITEELPTAQDSLESESSHRFYSPLVKNIANQENISLPELEGLKGTGADGRLTKDDLLSYISNKPSKDSPKPLV
ncbi:MAG: E3 binding domain-containing protein, partial [Pedobacter sp.]|nr:E3 binding domain-containing protein [Pedobacter sp.]